MACNYMDERWLIGYKHLVNYYNKYGNSLVPQRYVCDDGYNLGAFCEGQKNKKRKGTLEPERETLLEKVDFKYKIKNIIKLTWDEWYKEAELYYNEHGNLDVPIDYVTLSGNKLGIWVNEQAKNYRDNMMCDEHIIKLNSLDMKWYREEDNWYQKYDSLYAYYLKYGNIDLPVNYTDNNGNNLYSWVHYQKHKLSEGTLTKEQIDCLKELNIVPAKKQKKWECNYNKLYELCVRHGNIDVGMMFAAYDSELKNWMYNQRQKYFSNRLDIKEKRKLNAISFDWSIKDTKFLNNEIIDYQEYKLKMLKRMRHILEDLSNETENNINSIQRQNEIVNEIVKRMWR